MNSVNLQDEIAKILCNKGDITCEDCYKNNKAYVNSCSNHNNCRISEKTEEQLIYIFSPLNQNSYLEACAGSGKTEVLAMKAAYEFNKWEKKSCGIAVLTFTNEALNTIKERVRQFYKKGVIYPHYIGTLTGFIHGYIAQKFKECLSNNYIQNNNDNSYKIIDTDIELFKKHWINKYKAGLPQSYIYAHKVTFDHKINDYILLSPRESAKNYYLSNNNQVALNNYRENKKYPNAYTYNYWIKKISECKEKFLNDGYANFEDLNGIAYKILNEYTKIAKLLASRFPYILIDECQDLSWIEIQILDKLKEAGCYLHFIGDLHQAIFSFKDAKPEYTEEYISTFHKYHLTNNFRSCQAIVDAAKKIQNINIDIKGCVKDKCKANSVCYYEYEDIGTIVDEFKNILNKLEVSNSNAVILARNNTLVDKLKFGINDQNEKHKLLYAIYLWNLKKPDTRLYALQLAGKEIQKWFCAAGTKVNYYCPDNIDSVFQWRIFIKNILMRLSETELKNIEGQTYSDWYKKAKTILNENLKDSYQQIEPFIKEPVLFENIKYYSAPHGTANERIQIIDRNIFKNNVSIKSIHSVKGGTYDSVMLVSGKDKRSESGYWKNWIEDSDELSRIAYVACTRARISLIWAVYKLNDKDREKIESYGFNKIII